jgi:Fe2+ or Zn2+ uptake regulation protein
LGVGNDPRYNKTRCFEPFPFPGCSESAKARIRAIAEELDAHRKARQEAHPELTLTSIYNVLEKLRAEEPLTDKERVIHENGLVSILKDLHDQLDAAVYEAYGWSDPALSDRQMLSRLVELNRQRIEEERGERIRWLREDFQRSVLPAKVSGMAKADRAASAASLPLPWPKEFPDQVACVRDTMLRNETSLTAKEVASRFKGATVKAVEPALETLTALGIVAVYVTDSGRRWKGLTKTRGSTPPPAMTGTFDMPAPVMLDVADSRRPTPGSRPPAKG